MPYDYGYVAGTDIGGTLLPKYNANSPLNSYISYKQNPAFNPNSYENQDYGGRVAINLGQIWDSIGKDINETSTDVSNNPFTAGNFFTKTVPTALGVGTRMVLSPLQSVFGGISDGTNSDEPSTFGNVMGTIGEGFNAIQSAVSSPFKMAGLSDRYANLAGEGLTNIGLGYAGQEALLGEDATFGFKGLGLRKIEEAKRLSQASYDISKKAIYEDVNNFYEGDQFGRDVAMQHANDIMSNFESKIENNTITKTDLNTYKNTLNNLGVTNTDFLTKKFEEQFTTPFLSSKANEEGINNASELKANQERIDYYYNSSSAPDEIKPTIENIKKLEEAGVYDVNTAKGLTNFFQDKLSLTKKQAKVLNNDQGLINQANLFRKQIFQNTPYANLLSVANEGGAGLRGLNLTTNDLNEIRNLTHFDTAENPFKREPLIKLNEQGYLSKTMEANKDNTKMLYSFKLTKSGEKLAKDLGFDNKTITKWKDEGIAHHQIDAIDNMNTEKLLVPIVNDKELININNILRDEENPDLRIDKRFKSSSAVSTDLADLERVNSLEKSVKKMNKKYGLELDDEISKAEGFKDLKKIAIKINDKAVNLLINKDNFKQYAIKGLTTTKQMFKGIDDNIILKAVKKIGYNVEHSKTELFFNKKIKEITAKFKGEKDLLQQRLKNIYDEKNTAITQLKLKFNKYAEVKSDRIKEIKRLNANKVLIGDISKAITKVVKSRGWHKATTIEQLKYQFDRLDKEIGMAHMRGLQLKITDALDIKEITKSTELSIRRKITPEIEGLIFRMKQLWKANKSGYTNIDDLNQLYNDVMSLKSKSREIATKMEIERSIGNERDSNIIKEEGIANIVGKLELEKNYTLTDKLKTSINDSSLYMDYIYHAFGKIFGEVGGGNISKGNEIFVSNIMNAFNNKSAFEEAYMIPLAEKLGAIREEAQEWAYDRFAKQVSEKFENKFIGLDRMINDEKASHLFEKRITTSIGKPGWINDDWWTKIENTKLGEILEKGEFNRPEDWKLLDEKWNRMNDNIFFTYKRIKLDYDGVVVNEQSNYLPMKTTGRINELKFYEQDNFRRSAMADGHSYSRVETVENAGLNYEYDPTVLLLYGYQEHLMQNFIREDFEKMTGVYYGRKFAFSKLDRPEVLKLLDDRDGEGKSLYKITDAYGVEINKRGKELDDFILNKDDTDLAQLYITNSKGGIRAGMNETTRAYIEYYIKRISTGGGVKIAGIDKVLLDTTKVVSSSLMWGSPSSILAQPLSLLDASSIMGSRLMERTLEDILKEPSLIEKAERASPSVRNRKANSHIANQLVNKALDSSDIGKIKNSYIDFTNFGLSPLQWADEKTYDLIWIAAYREFIEKNNLIFDGDFRNIKGIKYANVKADGIAGTSQSIMKPKMFDSTFGKVFFSLASQQLSAYQAVKYSIKNSFSKGDYTRGIKTAIGFTASGAGQIVTQYLVAYALFNLGLSQYNPDKDGTLMQQIVSRDGLFQSTMGRTPLISKGISGQKYGTWSIIDSLKTNTTKSVSEMSKGEIKGLLDFMSTFIMSHQIKWGEHVLGLDANKKIIKKTRN